MSFKKLPCIPRFPYLLTLQLKRFDFDYSTMHRIKLNDRMWFPLILNLNSFIEREKVCLRAHADHQPAYLKLVKCQKKFIYPARQWTTASPRVGCRHLSVRFKIDKRYPAARPSSKSLWLDLACLKHVAVPRGFHSWNQWFFLDVVVALVQRQIHDAKIEVWLWSWSFTVVQKRCRLCQRGL